LERALESYSPEKLAAEITAMAARHPDSEDNPAFMSEFQRRFDVDMSRFHFLRYFKPTPFNPFAPALALFLCREPNFSRRWRAACDAERDLTIADLVRVAQAGRWLEPAAADAALHVVRKPYFGMSATAALLLLAWSTLVLGFICLIAWLAYPRYALGPGFAIVLCASAAFSAVQQVREKLASAP
jgi:Protein of unknown function (DUF1493)